MSNYDQLDELLSDSEEEVDKEVEEQDEPEEESEELEESDSQEETEEDDQEESEDEDEEDESDDTAEPQSTKKLTKALRSEREGRRSEKAQYKEAISKYEAALKDPKFLEEQYERLNNQEETAKNTPPQITIPGADAYPNTEQGAKRLEADQVRASKLLGDDLTSDTSILATVRARVATQGETYVEAAEEVLRLMGKRSDSFKKEGAAEKEKSVAKKNRMTSIDKPRAVSESKQSRLKADLNSKSETVRMGAAIDLLDSL